jgi:LPXTG-motif cell wall-anchored protein
MMSRRGRSEWFAGLAVLIGVLLLFWAPSGAGAIGEHTAVPHAAGRVGAVAEGATPTAPSVGSDDVTPVARTAEAAEDDLAKVGDAVGSAVDHVVAGHHSDSDTSGDSCRKDCPPPSDDQYGRASREQPPPEQNCADTCRQSSHGSCAASDCTPRSSEPGYGGCPSSREPADCSSACRGCAERDERPERPRPPERTAPPRCVERPGCPCPGNHAAPGSPPPAAENPPKQSAPASPPAGPGPAPAQPAPSSPPAQAAPAPAQPAPSAPPESGPKPSASPAPPPPAEAPGTAVEAATETAHPAPAPSNLTPTAPRTEAGDQATGSGPDNAPANLPRTGSRSGSLAMVGGAWIVAGLALVASGRRRRLQRTG